MSSRLVQWDHRRGGHDPGPQRRGRQQEMTVDRRVAGAIEAFEFLAGTGAPTR
jgi:hypothetical protein